MPGASFLLVITPGGTNDPYNLYHPGGTDNKTREDAVVDSGQDLIRHEFLM